MYIPDWIIVLAVFIATYFYWKKRKTNRHGAQQEVTSVEDIESNVRYLNEQIFALEHFDSPHFVDCQDAFDAMQINYFRLKQRFVHHPEKVLEVAKDWNNYASALQELKHARVMLDVDMDAWERDGDERTEYSIIKDEIEKKFKSLLGRDWQEIPPDYFKRMETMKKPDENAKAKLELGQTWRWYYGDSGNAYRLVELREKARTQSNNPRATNNKQLNDS